MTEYGDTGYGSGEYPTHGGGHPARDSGGSDTTYEIIRGRVWRPTRGPRAEEAARAADPGYGAPERGWRTADGGYRSTEGGWRAPYRPYDTGEWLRDQRPDTGPTGTGEIVRYSSGTGEIVRYGGSADTARGYPTDTGETARMPRQPPTSSGGYPGPRRRRTPDAGGGRRDDSAELYEYDPLTFGGGESPAMRYDRGTESYAYDAVPGEPPPVGPDPRRAPPPSRPHPGRYEARAIEAPTAGRWETGTRGHDSGELSGRRPDAGVYGGRPRPRAPRSGARDDMLARREGAPARRDDMPAPREGAPARRDGTAARRPAARRYDEPPAGRASTRPQQRFEGTYPARSVRNPRNVAPVRGRPAAGEDEEEAPGFLHTALVTTAWYTIPLLLYTMYVLTLDGSAEAGDGASARENALDGLLGGMPRIGVALVTSLAVALLIRLIGRGWRAATIGFASAVVGAGVATVIFTALQG